MVLSHTKIRQNLKLSVLKLETPTIFCSDLPTNYSPEKCFHPTSSNVFFHKLRVDPFLLFIKFSDFSGRFSSHQQVFVFPVENEAVFLLLPLFRWKEERSTNSPKVGM